MDPDPYPLHHRRVTLTATDNRVVMMSLRPLVEEEVMRAMKVSGTMSPVNLHHAVRQEVFQLFEDRTLVEALLGHRLREEMRAEFLQDQYRKGMSSASGHNSPRAFSPSCINFASPEAVESGKAKQAAETAQARAEGAWELANAACNKQSGVAEQIARLSDGMDLASGRIECSEGLLRNLQESVERLKAHHLNVLDGKSKTEETATATKPGYTFKASMDVLTELRQENTRFAEGIWNRLDRLEKDVEMTLVPRLEGVERKMMLQNTLSTEVAALQNNIQDLRNDVAPKVLALEHRHETEVRSIPEDLRKELRGELAALDHKHLESRSKAEEEIRREIRAELATLDHKHFESRVNSEEEIRKEIRAELAVQEYKHFESRSKAEEEIRKRFRAELVAHDHKHFENRSKAEEEIRKFRVELAAHDHKLFESRSKAEEEARRDLRAQLAVVDQQYFESRSKSEEEFRSHFGPHSDELRKTLAKSLELHQQQDEERHAAFEASLKDLQTQLQGLREWTVASEARQDREHESVRLELEQKICATANMPEVAVVRGDETIGAVERRLWEALQEHTAQIGRRLDLSQEQAERRHCDYAAMLEKRETAAEARLREALASQSRLGEELQAYTAFVEVLRNEDLPTKLTAIDQGHVKVKEEMRSHLETHIETLKAKVAHGDYAISGVEWRLQQALNEHASDIKRLEYNLQLKEQQTEKQCLEFQAAVKDVQTRVGSQTNELKTKVAMGDQTIGGVERRLLEQAGGIERLEQLLQAKEKQQVEMAEAHRREIQAVIEDLQTRVGYQTEEMRAKAEKSEVQKHELQAAVTELNSKLGYQADELKVKVDKGDDAIGGVERRLDAALQEHAAGIGGVEKRLDEALQEHSAGMGRLEHQLQVKAQELDAQRLELKATLEELQSRFGVHAGKLQAIAARGDEAIPVVERRFQEALKEHAVAIERLEQQLQLKVEESEKKHQSLQETIAECKMTAGSMNKYLESKLNIMSEAPQAVSRECAHRLHAIAYSLLEVIGEVELTGSTSEAREKRIKLHQHLCDRLGAVRPTTTHQCGPAMLEANEALPPSRPRSATGRNSRPQHVDMDDLAKNLEAKSVEMRTPKRNSASSPRPTNKVLHGLRGVRSMRLMDYSTFDGSDSRPTSARPTSARFFDGGM